MCPCWVLHGPCAMAVMTHYHEDGWYHEAHMESGRGVIDNKHSTDVRWTTRVRGSVRAL